MAALNSDRRRHLEKIVREARRVAEAGARAALEALAVGHHEPYSSLSDEQKELRKKLRAHGRQLGDTRDAQTDKQEIDRLIAECAYEHWHRMLFARFLAENELLIEPESQVSVSMDACAELAADRGVDAWELASRFAQRMLPQIFRVDDPVLQVALPLEGRVELEKLLGSLSADVFTADDSLGWTYQFWQSSEKDRVNDRAKAGEKITGRTLPAVTQLFTEHYMVLFLLHNTIGAWWAAKELAKWTDARHAACAPESDVRRAVALPGYEFEYLRFVRDESTKRWRPAAGAFESWPREAYELRVLDPCCGSGHFLVAAFDLLTRLREREEGLTPDRAALAVLQVNLFGLELDPRCTQIAAFALAFAAWKRIGGVRELPALRIACSGLAIHGEREEWAKLAGEDALLRGALESLHATFAQAPELGSLLDPRRADVGGFKLTVDLQRLLPLLTTALGRQSVRGDAEQLELGVTAQGLALAAELLSGSYTLVPTNVPYLGRKSHSDTLKNWADSHEKDAKNDLATLFVSRMLRWVGGTGTVAAVTPQNWLFLTSYRKLREQLLGKRTWNFVARLGPKGFQTPMWDFNVMLVVLSGKSAGTDHVLAGIDVAGARRPEVKAALLRGDGCFAGEPAAPSTLSLATERAGEPTPAPAGHVDCQMATSNDVAADRHDAVMDAVPDGQVKLVSQADQLRNPDAAVSLDALHAGDLLDVTAEAVHGLAPGDTERIGKKFWECDATQAPWRLMSSRPDGSSRITGKTDIIWNPEEVAQSKEIPGFRFDGRRAWGGVGVLVGKVGELPVTRYLGEVFDDNVHVLLARRPEHVAPVWAFCSSSDFRVSVRKINQKLAVTTSTIAKVPFDVVYWTRIAGEQYPHGLPDAQSNDATQWLFHGHPAGMAAAGPAQASPLGVCDPVGVDRHPSLLCREPNLAAVLQVAVARIAGYRWPAELDSGLRLDIATRAWVGKCDDLAQFADDDGVVSLVPMRNEPAAESRVRELLRVALGDKWSSARESALLAETARANGDTTPAVNLDDWLRNRFFEEHCALFHQRPFVWHIWDGRKQDGFGVLVHYHRLAAPWGAGRQPLEKITHGYLGDWITRQRDEIKESKDGADARFAAALALQERLAKILEGEPPYDIFVRWKPLHRQPIGWGPDINDGVRINIRPFVEADVLRVTPKVKWTKDRGSEPQRPKAEYPWFWGWDEPTVDFGGGPTFKGERFNDLHYTTAFKQAARERKEGTT